MRKLLKYALTVFVLAAALYLIWRTIDLERSWEALRAARWGWVAAAAVFGLVSFLVKTYRWKLLIRPTKNVAFRPVLSVYSISQMTSNVLPFRGGDIVQLIYFSARENVSRTKIAATIAAGQLLDLFSMLLMFVVLSFFFAFPHALSRTVMTAIFILAAGAGVYAAAARKVTDFLGRWRFARRRVELFYEATRELSRPAIVAAMSALTAALWVITYAQVWCVFRAFSINASAMAILSYLTLPSLVAVLPSTPGFIGVWELAAVTVLAWFGIDKAPALSAAAVHHAIGMAVTVLLGMTFVIIEGFDGRRGRRNPKGEMLDVHRDEL